MLGKEVRQKGHNHISMRPKQMKGVSSVDQTRKELSRGHGLADNSKCHCGDAHVEVMFVSTETTPEVGMVSLLRPLFNCMLIYCV